MKVWWLARNRPGYWRSGGFQGITTRWTVQSPKPQGKDLFGVSFFDAEHGWAVGGMEMSSKDGVILTMRSRTVPSRKSVPSVHRRLTAAESR